MKVSAKHVWLRMRVLFRRSGTPRLVASGLFSYVLVGVALLSLPWAHHGVGFIDNLFVAVSAMSTTGLSTVSVPDDYSVLGQVVILLLFQVGALGYMTLSSFVILSRRAKLPPGRERLLAAQFTLPRDFNIRSFLKQMVVFTLVLETLGALALYVEFRDAGVSQPAWQAVFHSVSAFCTAGFSLNNDNLVAFSGNWLVNLTIGVLCYAGGIGFIVMVDAWRMLTRREYKLTFTSRVILAATGVILLICAPVLAVIDPILRELPLGERVLVALFQVMTASSTAGFNTVPINAMGPASLLLITVVMVIGASPSGTGGGVKTTTVSALLAVCKSTLRGEPDPSLGRQTIPPERLHTAVTNLSMYLATLTAGIFVMGLTEGGISLAMIFEAASALGTVGLSMGVTTELTDAGKLAVTALMFVGRLGPLTAGLAFLHRRLPGQALQGSADLSV